MYLPILNILKKWNYTMYSILWLVSFTKHGIFGVHICCSINRYFIPFYSWVIFHLWIFHFFIYIHQLIHTWVVSVFWLWWTMLLWKFTCKYLCGLFFILGIYLWVELKVHMVTTSNISWNCPVVFKSDHSILQPHQQWVRFRFLYILPLPCYFPICFL